MTPLHTSLAALLALALLCPLAACSDDDTQDNTNNGQVEDMDASDGDQGSDQDTGQSDADQDTDQSDASEEDMTPDTQEEDMEPDVPAGPYDSVEGLSDDALKDGLHELVRDHRSYGYNNARDLMYGASGSIDVHDGVIEGIYTGTTAMPDGTRTPGELNTEHSWPRSDGADTEPARSDLHHLFPAQSRANQERGSHPFGYTSCNGGGCLWSEAGSKLGPPTSGGAGYAFEVRPLRRGDIARAHFYFSVRYQLPIPDTEEADLRQWHQEDPVDDWEIQRHEAVVSYQENRNPFIDRPDFVERISDF
jgi:endonuclease I